MNKGTIFYMHQKRFGSLVSLSLIALALSTVPVLASGDDWPTYRHDNRRSGVSAEAISPETLQEQWVYQPVLAPQTAWHGPAKWDAFAGIENLRSMRNFDPCYFVIAVGDVMFFASSAEDTVYCLDTATGEERWSRMFGGAVRMPPTYADAKLFLGADDGYAYCLNAADGAPVWKYAPAPKDRMLPSNGKLIALRPCRTGVLVEDGKAYFAMALLPWEKSFLCAVNALTGKPEGPGTYCRELQEVTMEGALLASPSKLYVPQGRTSPLVFNRADGERQGIIAEAGGVFAILTPDNKLVHGPSNQKESFLALTDTETKDKIASFERGNFMIVTEKQAFILRDADLISVERSSGNTLWTVPCDCPYVLIMVGNVLWAGGEDKVVAFSSQDGKVLRTLPAKGRVYGLSAANGRLYGSTDTGMIHCWK